MQRRRIKKQKSKSTPRPANASLSLRDADLPQLDILKGRLTNLSGRAMPVTLDVSALTRIDSPSLQLLVAFVRDRQAKGRGVIWRGVAAWFEAAARELGLTAALALALS